MGHSPNPAGVKGNARNKAVVVTCNEHRRPSKKLNDKSYRKALVKKLRFNQPSGPVDSNGDPVKFANTPEVPPNVLPKGGVQLNAYSPLLIKGSTLDKCYVYSWRTTWLLLNKQPEMTEDRSGHIVFGHLKLRKGATRDRLLLWQRRAAERLELRETREKKKAIAGKWKIVPGGAVPETIMVPAGAARGNKYVQEILRRARKRRMPTKRHQRMLHPPKPKPGEKPPKKFFYALNPYGENDGRAILVWNLPDRARGGAVIALLSDKDVFYRANRKPICMEAVVYKGPGTKLRLVEAIFVYGFVKKAYGFAKPKGDKLRAVKKGKKLYGWMLASITDGKNQPIHTVLRNQKAPP